MSNYHYKPSRHTDFGYHVRRATRAGIFRRRTAPVGGKPPGRKKDWKKFWSWFAIIGVAVFFAGTVGGIAVVALVSRDLPDPNNIVDRTVAQTTRIYDRTGTHVLYEIHGAQKRTIVNLEDISDYVKQATIAAEDRNFYQHHGLDFKGMARSLLRIVGSGGQEVVSGSTITQQFIKKAVLTDDKTPIRKAREIILALEMERRFSKDQILKLYLNEIPYGSVAYGIESASQTFFGKSAKDLDLGESAILASLPNGPTRFSPYGNHLDALVARQHYVLDGMVEMGYIKKDEAAAAKWTVEDVQKNVLPKREAISAPHFVFYVKEQLAEEYGEDMVERGGLKVITTLDWDKQAAAEKAIKDNVENIAKWKANTAALVSMDEKSGDILAMVGSADYFDETINGQYNAVLGHLQPGSSIKPIVYAAAFEKGFTPSTVVEDETTQFGTGGTNYMPHDYDLKERGPMTLKESLAGSLNIPAVKVLYLTGLEKFQDFAQRVGYTTFGDRSRYGLSLVLGGAEVNMIEHVAAFAAFGQEGMYRPTKAILKVEDKDGKILKDNTDPTPAKRAYDVEIARQINDILSDNSARAYVFGEKNYLTLSDRPVAAKTGTTNDFKDAWTVGYTPSIATAVWVGNSKGEFMKSGADGSKIAAPIWNQYMREALKGTPVENFTAPQPVVTGKPVLDGDKNSQVVVKVDRISGKLATALTPPEYVEERRYGTPHSILFFVNKDDPRGPAPEHPEQDPQYANWEAAVTTYLAANPATVVTDNSTPPTEFDDVHTAENAPEISILTPWNNGTVSDRNFQVSVSAIARRGVNKVEYFMDGVQVGTSMLSPFNTTVTVPNRIAKGFRTLTARAYDDVGNRTEAGITVNFTAEPGPIGVSWVAPYHQQIINGSEFPFTVRFSLDDPKSVSNVSVTARDKSNNTTEVIGSIDSPALPNMQMSWKSASAGTYDLTVEATLASGEKKSEYITVTVR